ncbi:MAG: RES family NAD+ phosphorylase [Bacteroidetes bacterium]|nr:RES family NAD+ phosphorylase [Bacteroidota bacterium]MBS1591343.1 RES family NAD+ phosphorylase [Bacteroidota bacterium]
MIVYRFSPKQFVSNLSGEGSRLYGGRWNNKGLPALYTSLTTSLALVELLIHNASYHEIKNNCLALIELPEKSLLKIETTSLKKNWWNDEEYTKYIGSEFLASKKYLLLKIPSAIVHEEFNIIINPLHQDFKKIKLKEIKDFTFDARLFKTV